MLPASIEGFILLSIVHACFLLFLPASLGGCLPGSVLRRRSRLLPETVGSIPPSSHDLMKAVPDEHKKFLVDMLWVHEEDDVCVETEEGAKHCRLIAVHAGLVKGEGVEEQLKRLKSKDTGIPKVEALSGRKSVWDIPEELKEKPTVIVSGHHGKLHIDGLRLIIDEIDEGGGYKHRPVAAIILPSIKLVRDTDCLK